MKKIAMTCCMCFALLCSTMMLFSGCDNKNYAYAELQAAYTTFVTENTNALFDSDGYVSITYENEIMANLINQTDMDSKMSLFTRLSSVLDSDQAIFEPALKSSLMFVNKYINVPTDAVPVNISTKLYHKFMSFKNQAEIFLLDKRFFDEREDCDYLNAVVKSKLNILLNDYYTLLKTSCEFSKNFIDVYNKYIFIDASDRKDGRIAIGKINKYYLESLTKLSDVYINTYLGFIYDKAENQYEEEIYTKKFYAKDINSALKSYLKIDNKIKSFEERTGEMSAEEKAVITAYKSANSYNEIFDNSYAMVLEIMPKIQYNAMDSSNIEKGFDKILNDFYTCEYKNLTQLINTISDKILVA